MMRSPAPPASHAPLDCVAYFPLPSRGASPYGLSCGCVGATPFIVAASDDGQLLYVRLAAADDAPNSSTGERYEACLLPLPGLPAGASIVSVTVVPAVPARSEDESCLVAVAIALPPGGSEDGTRERAGSGGDRGGAAGDEHTAGGSSGGSAAAAAAAPSSDTASSVGVLHLYHVGALLRGGIVGVEATSLGAARGIAPLRSGGGSGSGSGSASSGASASAAPQAWHESVGVDWFGNALSFGSALMQNHPCAFAPLGMAVVRPVAGAPTPAAPAPASLPFAAWYAHADACAEARFDFDGVPPALMLCGSDRRVHAFSYDSFEMFDCAARRAHRFRGGEVPLAAASPRRASLPQSAALQPDNPPVLPHNASFNSAYSFDDSSDERDYDDYIDGAGVSGRSGQQYAAVAFGAQSAMTSEAHQNRSGGSGVGGAGGRGGGGAAPPLAASILGILDSAAATTLPYTDDAGGDAARRAARRGSAAVRRPAVKRECEALDALPLLDERVGGFGFGLNAGGDDGGGESREEEVPPWQRDYASVLAPLRRRGMPSAPMVVDVISLGSVLRRDGLAAAESDDAACDEMVRAELALLGFEDGRLELWARDVGGMQRSRTAQLDGMVTSVQLVRGAAAGCIDAVVCGANGWAIHFARVADDSGALLEGLDAFVLLPRSAEFDCVTCSLVVDLEMDGTPPSLLLGTTSGALLHYRRGNGNGSGGGGGGGGGGGRSEEGSSSSTFTFEGTTLVSSPILALGVLAGPDATSVDSQRIALYSLDGVLMLRPPVARTVAALEAAVTRLEALAAAAVSAKQLR